MRIPMPSFVPAASVNTGIELISYTDNPGAKTVTADVSTCFGVETLMLWEGPAYDLIGQWTDGQALARAVAVFRASHTNKIVTL